MHFFSGGVNRISKRPEKQPYGFVRILDDQVALKWPKRSPMPSQTPGRLSEPFVPRTHGTAQAIWRK